MSSRILQYYPMIHKDKLIYKYTDDIIRIGTDDNDVIEIKDVNHKIYPVLKSRDCKIVCVRMNDSLNLFL